MPSGPPRRSHAALDLGSRRAKALKIERLLDLAHRPSPIRMLDIGTGAGAIAHYFATHPTLHCAVTAVDVSDQRQVRDGYRFALVTDALPFSAASFDVIITNHVIKPVGARSRQLAHLLEVRRVLAADGDGYLAVPNRWSLIEPHYHLAFLSWLPRPLRTVYLRLMRGQPHYDCEPLSLRELDALLAASGLAWQHIEAEALRALLDLEVPRGPAAAPSAARGRRSAVTPPRSSRTQGAPGPAHRLVLRIGHPARSEPRTRGRHTPSRAQLPRSPIRTAPFQQTPAAPTPALRRTSHFPGVQTDLDALSSYDQSRRHPVRDRRAAPGGCAPSGFTAPPSGSPKIPPAPEPGPSPVAMPQPHVVVIEPGLPERHYWQDLWHYRELFYVLAWRDLAVRYKQTIIGVAWTLIRPLLTMAVFTIVFSTLAKLPSVGTSPYALMVFAGLLPWQFFSTALTESSASLINNANLISKVYFPRLIVPAATIVVAFFDFFISFLILLGLMAWYRYLPGPEILALPIFVLMACLASLGPGLWITALNARYRDFRYVIPFLVQFGLYLSPVGFCSSVVPEQWRLVYSLNPLVGIIDGFRWALLRGGSTLYVPGVVVSWCVIVFFLWFGIRQFRRTEKTLTDVI